ncbi:MAG TPA: mechanosensitive ion channel family protein [Thermoplasmata archaeon]|nr:mechanosensitive ion channel family protein [Thermoplasmata archaeon]
MAAPPPSHPGRILLRNLVLVILLGAALFALFNFYNKQVLHGFTDEEVLLLEAGAILLVAWLAARAFTGASDEVLRRRGQVHHGATIRIFLNVLIAVGAILALFELAGVSAQSIFLGSAFAGIVLGLAAQTVLANVFAGLLLVVASPFRPGDRVSLISSSYGALAPSYPHELTYPSYSGTVDDIELLYTILRLDAGGMAKVPNSVVLSALILQPKAGGARLHRVRMTFPISMDAPLVEAAVADVAAAFPTDAARTPPRLEVADISSTTWDGVIVLWSSVLDEWLVRDRVMRAVLARVRATLPPPAASPSTGPH